MISSVVGQQARLNSTKSGINGELLQTGVHYLQRGIYAKPTRIRFCSPRELMTSGSRAGELTESLDDVDRGLIQQSKRISRKREETRQLDYLSLGRFPSIHKLHPCTRSDVSTIPMTPDGVSRSRPCSQSETSPVCDPSSK